MGAQSILGGRDACIYIYTHVQGYNFLHTLQNFLAPGHGKALILTP
jgi:hypothetical protein